MQNSTRRKIDKVRRAVEHDVISSAQRPRNALRNKKEDEHQSGGDRTTDHEETALLGDVRDQLEPDDREERYGCQAEMGPEQGILVPADLEFRKLKNAEERKQHRRDLRECAAPVS